VLKIRHCGKPPIVDKIRLALSVSTKATIKNGLTIPGVSAPEKI